jgi:ribulose-5-phosphate 4-epimerase/fuculose-1-phosphate aldolase
MKQRGVGSVMHSHALSAVLAADIAMGKDYFLIEGLEMLKGISGENNKSRHVVPIVDNTMYERELTQEIQLRLDKPRFANAYCILVRDHGAYIWGRDLWETKRHAEVYHYLFEATVARKKMGIKKEGQPLAGIGSFRGTPVARPLAGVAPLAVDGPR